MFCADVIRNCLIFSKRKYPCISQCFSHHKKTFIGMSGRYKWPNQDKNLQSVIVRSEIAGTGSHGSSYQLSGLFGPIQFSTFPILYVFDDY